jgi:hypothetical protein
MSRFSQSAAVTPSNSANIFGGNVCADAIMVDGSGAAGDIALVLQDDTVVNIKAAALNSIWEFAVKRVNSTGTTATVLKALKY